MQTNNVRRNMRHEESNLQKHCFRWFNYQYPEYQKLLFAIPNGARRNHIQGKLLKDEGMVAGVSDLILLIGSQGYNCLCIEMKNGNKGRQSLSQKEWQKQVEKHNNKYVVIRNIDEFIDVVVNYIKN